MSASAGHDVIAPVSSPDMDAPLAVYRERLLQVRRVLELYPDRVVVHARWLLGGRFQQTVRLETLKAQTREVWVRQRLFKRALVAAILFAAIALAAVIARPEGGGVPMWLVYAIYAVAVAAGVVAMLAWPKVQFVRFLNKSGAVGLDVARAGPDARSFDEFIQQLRRQIRKG